MKQGVFSALEKTLPRVKRNVALKNHTTFKIGGPAEYFFIAKDKRHIMKAIAAAKKVKLPIFIFGGGSNLLVSDNGIEGLVVKIKNNAVKLLPRGVVHSSAGVDMKKLVAFSLQKSLGGLEWAGGLPGTFGGAIRGNAGAFGGEMKDSILEVEAMGDAFKVKKFSNAQCKFSYRNSLFKEKGWIIISAKVQLKKGDQKALRAVAQSHINYRKERHPLEYPSAGSIFKNVDVRDIPAELQEEFADKIKKDPFPIVPAAWLIIGAGLTGKTIGQAQISTKHSNYMVNLGNAKAVDVLALIDFAKQKVREKYGIELEPEVQFVGDRLV